MERLEKLYKSELAKEKIEITIDVLDNVSTVTGFSLGAQTYRKYKHLIDVECINVIRFPAYVNRVSESFLYGFFNELIKCMTLGEIKEHFLVYVQEKKYLPRI